MSRTALTTSEILALGRRTEDGCLLWPFGTNGNGYGRVSVGGRAVLVHRHIWTQLRGDIPADMTLDHVCHNEAASIWLCNGGDHCLHRRCYEVSHLAVKSLRDNWLDGLRGFPAQAALRTHCRRGGHPYSGDNLAIAKDGSRRCKTCERESAARVRRRKQASRPPKPPKTHCVNGHPWTPENVVTYGRTQIRHQCRICRRESQLRYRPLKRS